MQPVYSSHSSLREQLLHWRPKKVHKNNMQRLHLVWQWIIHWRQNTAVSQARYVLSDVSLIKDHLVKNLEIHHCVMYIFFNKCAGTVLHYSELSGSQQVGTSFLIPSRGRAAVVVTTDNSQSCLSQYVTTNMNTKVVYRKQKNIHTYRGWVRNACFGLECSQTVPTVLQNMTQCCSCIMISH